MYDDVKLSYVYHSFEKIKQRKYNIGAKWTTQNCWSSKFYEYGKTNM